jgi:hypothetical protein
MRKFRCIGLTFLAICLAASNYNTYARSNQNDKNKNVALKNNSMLKTNDSPTLSVLDINNLTTYIQNDGTHPPVVALSWAGQFPKGSGLGGIYQEGILWGGKVTDGGSEIVRVGGNTYTSGNYATSPMFRVRPDYKTANLTDDAANFFQVSLSAVTVDQISTIYQQYDNDWKNWPANLGAPFAYGKDALGNQRTSGAYDPNLDIPGIPGASQTIFTQYDDRFAVDLYSSIPIGIEVQEILWAYASNNQLANVNFKKVRLVYNGTSTTSGNARIDSMYIAQFSDPDIGNASDDFAGSDTLLNMGYAYNSTSFDSKYSPADIVPPAMGYDFLQGASYKTGNQNDSAIVNLKWRHGYKYFSNKPLSTMVYFVPTGESDVPLTAVNSGNYDDGTLAMYNYLRGYVGYPWYPFNKLFIRPAEFGGPVGGVGTYLLDGDPVAGTGWNDGVVDGPGDRRILAINGPISMSLHDTAEVVLALVGGIGYNNLTSISVMKYNDIYAKYAFNNLFNLPSFPTPIVQEGELDGQVVLNWGSDPVKVNEIESTISKGYKFEGYNVFQLPSASSGTAHATKIATYDLINDVTTILDNTFDVNSGAILQVPSEIGKNTGIFRYIVITQDAINNKPLINGQQYYFAVTAYYYNPSSIVPFHALESSLNVISVTPHSPNAGTSYPAEGTVVNAAHTSGASSGIVKAVVVDPTKVTGANYQVSFKDNGSGSVDWTLKKGSQILLDNQTNQSGDSNYLIADGLEVIVKGPTSTGLKSEADSGLAVIVGTRRITQLNADAYAAYLTGWRGVVGYLSPANFFNGLPMVVKPSECRNILIKLATVDTSGTNHDYNPRFTASDPNVSYGYRYLRNAQNTAANPLFAPFIKNTSASYAYQDYTQSIPLAVYNIDDPANPKRLAVGFLENNVVGGEVDGKYWPSFYNDITDNTSTSGPREWLYIIDDPYTGATPDQKYQTNINTSTTARVMYMAVWNRRDKNAWTGTDQMALYAYKINTTADVFSFMAPMIITSVKQDAFKIGYGLSQNYPNPFNPTTTINYSIAKSGFVSIKIYNVLGQEVATLVNRKEVVGNHQVNFDAAKYNLASGIYMYTIRTDGFTVSKKMILLK